MIQVGEIFLSAFLQVLFQQLSSAAMKALARQEKIESRWKKLSQNFELIMVVLDDAEEKQLMEGPVKVWLESLRDLAYDMGDVLDEISTRYLIHDSKRVDDDHRDRANALWRCIPTCSRFAPSRLKSNYRVMSKLKEIMERLEYVVKQKNDLSLKESSVGAVGRSNRSSVMRLTTSLVHESHVYGRDDDKEAILEMLVGDEVCGHFSVIPIVGMGGIGKTTLAQLVYNNRVVKENFHVKAWACVSEEFDVQKITKTIFKHVTGQDGENMDLDLLQVKLQDKLSKSKFLIVLDDVWHESNSKWDLLLRPFQFGLAGSKIIVTTRNDTIPSVVGSPRTAYHMKLLTDDDCLALLALHSGRSLSEIKNSEFREVGLELARKCKGLPLAAKTLGGILGSKGTKEGWEAVLNSKLWDLPDLSEENKILPVLRLSYHHLPSRLKHLFAYCCIFPKDYEFNKNELVLIWMGEGFLETQGEKSKEDLGLDYFDELLSRSFFQRLSNCESLFVMHDLINDLAHFVAGGICYRLDEKMDTNLEYQLPEKVRHVSFLRHEYEVFRKFRAFSEVQGLRTFLPMPVQNSHVWPPFHLSNKILVELVPKLPRLRVLSLSGYFITELPSTVCNLMHLRYLNLSGTSIVMLPGSLGELYNLETLSLCNCRCIRYLPPAIGNLQKLRHLDNSGTDQLKDMPVEIGDLKELQMLPKVVLSKVGSLGLKELKDLKLRGKLSIQELQNVTDEDDVEEAYLRSKHLDELQLSWGSDIDNPRSKCSEDEVLNLLEPPENLKKLEINCYGGVTFPAWVGDPLFRKLSTVVLINCTECTSLPPLGQLLELKELHVREMPKIKCIGIEFYGNRTNIAFPKLEILRFSDMPAWEKWSCFGGDDSDERIIQFPQLHQLAILGCQKLTDVSPLSFPVLHMLDLEECNSMVLERFENLITLSYLKIESIPGLTHIPTGLLHSLSALDVLECCACNDLLSLWPDDVQLDHLTRLRRLVVADCLQLKSIGEGEMQLPCNLEVLELFKCADLVVLPDSLSNHSSLKELIIKNCSGIINFPENGVPPMLKRLEILSCTDLVSLPTNISNLERLEIKDCSSLRGWGTTNFPTDLKKLSIKNCTQLAPVSDTMFCENVRVSLEELSLCEGKNFGDLLHHLNGFRHLVELYLSKCSELRHFPENALPPQLRVLSIDDCGKLKSLPPNTKSMTSLASLEIRSCPKLGNFPGHDLPPNLSSIRIWDSKKFKPLAKWGLHRLRSLTEFSICGGFRDLKLLGEDNIFPTSLIRVSIARFQELSSLSKVLENLTSLRHLSITNCEKLNDLPSERLLERLWNLEISQCPVLSQKCIRDKGEYWPKISGIPCVKVDQKYVYQRN